MLFARGRYVFETQIEGELDEDRVVRLLGGMSHGDRTALHLGVLLDLIGSATGVYAQVLRLIAGPRPEPCRIASTSTNVLNELPGYRLPCVARLNFTC